MHNLLKNIDLLLTDVDGVLTTGDIAYTGSDTETKTFHVRDGLGIRLVKQAGVAVGIVTGRKSAALDRRARELGIDLCFDGVSKKGELLDTILAQTGCRSEAVAFIGDDLNDISMMKRVGVAIAVADAEAAVKPYASIITEAKGGKGAVREVCNAIVQARGYWEDILKQWE
ncbi:MAG: KdsC family phosphatase [Thermodesulfobacteriota bacterium]